MFSPYGYGLQGENDKGQGPQCEHEHGSTRPNGKGRRFTLNGCGVQVDVGQLVAVHLVSFGYGLQVRGFRPAGFIW